MIKYVALSIIITFIAGNVVMAQGRNAANPPNSRGSVNSQRPSSAGQRQIPSRPSPQSSSGRAATSQTGLVPKRSSQSTGLSSQTRLNDRSRSKRRDSDHRLRSRPVRENKQNIIRNSGGVSQRDQLTRITGRERAFQQKIANIDRIRDKALETDNTELLKRADELELAAKNRYEAQNGKFATRSDRRSERPESNEHGFGREISKLARLLKRDFGQTTSESARTLGQEFGRSNADKTRSEIYDPLLPQPDIEPLPEVDPSGKEQLVETTERPSTVSDDSEDHQ